MGAIHREEDRPALLLQPGHAAQHQGEAQGLRARQDEASQGGHLRPELLPLKKKRKRGKQIGKEEKRKENRNDVKEIMQSHAHIIDSL